MAESGAELLARIQPQLRRGRTQVCLRPDLLDEHERLEQQLAESVTNDKAGQRLASGTSKRTRELASKVLTLEEQIEAASPWFTYEALPKDKFAVVKERHPPRK